MWFYCADTDPTPVIDTTDVTTSNTQPGINNVGKGESTEGTYVYKLHGIIIIQRENYNLCVCSLRDYICPTGPCWRDCLWIGRTFRIITSLYTSRTDCDLSENKEGGLA